LRRFLRRSRAPRSASARALQRGVATLEVVECLAEQGRPALAAGNDTGGAFGHAERPRGAERPGEFEFLCGSAFGLVAVAECEVSERGLRSPGEVTRADDQRSGEDGANRQQVLEPLGDSPLCDLQSAAGEPDLGGDCRSLLGFRVNQREHVLGRVEIARINQCPDEYASVQDAIHGWCGKFGCGKCGAGVYLSGTQIATLKREPAAGGQADGESAAVAGHPRLGDR
jgi:hypothetical protein